MFNCCVLCVFIRFVVFVYYNLLKGKKKFQSKHSSRRKYYFHSFIIKKKVNLFTHSSRHTRKQSIEKRKSRFSAKKHRIQNSINTIHYRMKNFPWVLCIFDELFLNSLLFIYWKIRRKHQGIGFVISLNVNKSLLAMVVRSSLKFQWFALKVRGENPSVDS